jgi:hypothetical protein
MRGFEESRMSSRDTRAESDGRDPIVVEAARHRDQRDKTYRERALKIYPWICGRCGREFSGKRLRELTVHHKDHDHDNNPPDGSNWELLCLYCHDNEHERHQVADAYEPGAPGEERQPTATYKPFAALADVLKRQK